MAAAFALIACGDVKSNPDGSTGDDDADVVDFSLAASPMVLTVPIASSRTSTLTVSRTGPAGPVNLVAQNVPAGVTVSFGTNPIPEGSNTSEITVSVAGGTTPASSTITLVGSASGVERTTTLSIMSTTITVAGTVRGGRPNVTVRIVGKAATTTDSSGNFSFSDVTPPYDIYAVGATGGILGSPVVPTVAYYKGLTRMDPELLVPASGFPIFAQVSTATISGVKNGTGDTSPSNPVCIAWSNGGSPTTATSDVGGFSHTASWPQANTNTGTLYGLQWTKSGQGAPATYLGLGATNATLTAGQTSNLLLMMAAPASTGTVSGTITVPNGYPAPSVQLYQQLGSNSCRLWPSAGAAESLTATPSATIVLTPAGKSSFYAISSVGTGATSSRTAYVHPAIGATTDISFSMPAPAVQTNPVDTATGVTTSTQFTFTASASTLNQLIVSTAGTTKAGFYVYTTDAMATIPNVPELPLPPNQSFTWSVQGFGPHTNIDEAAGPSALKFVSAAEYTGTRHFFTNGPDRTFTSAP